MRNYRATDDETDRGGTVSATDCDVAIIGAGPYGLAAAAHLHAANGLDIRVFGDPMSFWHEQMPRGMVLRSPYVASNIADPERELTLDGYQELTKQQLPRPVALEQFVDYGRWFQDQALPGTHLDRPALAADMVSCFGQRVFERLNESTKIAAGLGDQLSRRGRR